jgi:hypothetical protein
LKGVTRKQSSRWQRTFDIPEAAIEQEIAQKQDRRAEITTAGLARPAVAAAVVAVRERINSCRYHDSMRRR